MQNMQKKKIKVHLFIRIIDQLLFRYSFLGQLIFSYEFALQLRKKCCLSKSTINRVKDLEKSLKSKCFPRNYKKAKQVILHEL